MSARKSLAFSFLDRYASLGIGIVSTVVLARLLTPAEVGVFSVAMALLSLASTMRDMGAGGYLLQEKELTIERIRAVWAVQLGLGAALALLVAGLSQPAAWFYNEPRMQGMMLLLALNYLVNPFGSLTYAALMRDMRYEAVAVMRFSSALSGALVSVWLAWRGHGPISLAWGSLCATAVNAGVATLYRPKHYPWLPGLKEIRRVLAFGTRTTSASMMTAMAAAAPEFLLGKLQGLAAAGFYSRANGLADLFSRLVTDAVHPVALSLFSRESRDGKDFSQSFLLALSYITALSWSFCLTLIFLAYPAVRLLYGEQWDASVDLTRWLAGSMALLAPVPLCAAALVGSGRLRPMMFATAVSAGSKVIAAMVGAVMGLQALGAALLLASFVSSAFWLHAALRNAGLSWPASLREFGRSAAVAACAATPSAGAMLWFGAQPAVPLLPLALGGVGLVAALIVSALVFQHPLKRELTHLGRAVLQRVRRPRGGLDT